MSVTIIGHDGNVDGHEEVGSSAVKRQCAPAADAEKKNKKGWILSIITWKIAKMDHLWLVNSHILPCRKFIKKSAQQQHNKVFFFNN